MQRTLRRRLFESGGGTGELEPLDAPIAVTVDPLQSTDSSSGISIGSDMTFDDYLVLGVSAVMILACIVMVYFFTASRNLKYGEDKALLEDEKKKTKKKKLRTRAAGAEGYDEEEKVDPATDKTNKRPSDMTKTTKKLKSKMKKKPQGILKTVMEDYDNMGRPASPGSPKDIKAGVVTLEDIDSVRGIRATAADDGMTVGRVESFSDNGSSSDNYSSVASSLHEDILKQTLLTVLGGGLTIIQHRPNAEPKPISLALDGTVLRWKSKKLIARNAYTMDLARVTSIEWGKHAVAFAKFSVSDINDDVCFSLVTDEEFSLDLQCSSKTERDTLVHGISLMVSDARSGGRDASQMA